MQPTTNRIRREAIMKKYEKQAYDAERAGDKVLAQTMFQLAENYKYTKDREQ